MGSPAHMMEIFNPFPLCGSKITAPMVFYTLEAKFPFVLRVGYIAAYKGKDELTPLPIACGPSYPLP